jgi:hypothetical protein
MTPDVNAGRPSYLGDGGGEDEPHGVDEGEDETTDVNTGTTILPWRWWG